MYICIFYKCILFQFFDPLEPVEIVILFNNNNRPSGEANVEFSSKEDAMRAMSKVIFFILITEIFKI